MGLRNLTQGCYAVGEGPIDTVYDDALYGAEQGDMHIVRAALRELSRRHANCAEALARVTNTKVDRAPTFHDGAN